MRLLGAITAKKFSRLGRLGSHSKQLFDPMYNFDWTVPGAKCYLAITIYPSAIVLTRPELENRILSTCYLNTGHLHPINILPLNVNR